MKNGIMYLGISAIFNRNLVSGFGEVEDAMPIVTYYEIA
jgi:hypothetical protein